MKGELSPARFKGIRVPWGIYTQRGGKVFMTRVRVPAGEATADQLKALAFVSKKYGNGKLHITTRQDIQIHEVKIEDTAVIIDCLKEHNLSPRGGGGNTVRNIVACELAGVCEKELFDVGPQAVALTGYLLSEESSLNLPRKFKIAFAGCSRGWRSYLLNDVGLLAKIENGKKGYQVFVGGGMGMHTHIGRELESFIPMANAARVVEAVKQTFNRYGDRKNRHRNRLGFLIEDLGLEKFAELYRKELAGLKEIELSEIAARVKTNGARIELRVPRGDIDADRLIAVAELEKDFPGIEFRTSTNQNLIIIKVKSEDLDKLSKRLERISEDFRHPRTLLDVVACKGAQTCNLGICNSPGLSIEIEKLIKNEFINSEVFKKLDIKLNGCPNACGRHPVGKLAFHGMVKKIGNRPIPFYKFLMGAGKKGDRIKLAEEVGALPAKNVPAFLREFLKRADEELLGNRSVSKEIAGEILLKYSGVPAYEENRDFYIDWGKTEDFSLAGIGPGECGAGIVDMIESDLKDAKTHLEGGDYRKALIFSARALLVVKGIEPRTDSEVLSNFKTAFVEEGLIAYRFKDVTELALSLLTAKYVQELYDEVSSAYHKMDSNFHFAVKEEIKQAAEKEKIIEKEMEEGEPLMDLRGVACPLNYVKVKLRLENMEKGQKLLIYLDPGEPIENVPASLRSDGQDVMKVEEKNEYFEVLVKKEV